MTLSAPSFSAAFTRPSMPPTPEADVALAASLPELEPELLSDGGAHAASASTLRPATRERRSDLRAMRHTSEERLRPRARGTTSEQPCRCPSTADPHLA